MGKMSPYKEATHGVPLALLAHSRLTRELLFFPTEATCPTAGEIRVTGDQRGTILFTSTGGVEIDKDDDGTVDETFANCDEVGACA